VRPASAERLEVAERAVQAAAQALEAACDELCRLDAAAGDGDHGFAMAGAAKKIRSDLADNPPADLVGLVDLAAAALATVGGAMGALGYVLVQALREPVAEQHSALTATGVAELLAAAENAVTSFGGAKTGDKTVVDALATARAAAEESARLGASASQALSKAAAGARDGAAATAEMIAKMGRASRLGERSRGSVDPGAKSFAIVVSALADAYTAESAASSHPASRTGS
jgi:dihydroxyacetone kinase-like protein